MTAPRLACARLVVGMLDRAAMAWRRGGVSLVAEERNPLRVVVIGAGMAGILSAIKLREAGYDNIGIDTIRRLGSHRISGDYILAMQSLGYRPSPDELIRLRSHGVSVEIAGSRVSKIKILNVFLGRLSFSPHGMGG